MADARHHIDSLYQKSLSFGREFKLLNGIDFCSNDYLSLKAHPHLKKRLASYLHDMPALCSTGSRLVSGTTASLLELEAKFARFVKRPHALFCANGYVANLTVISALFSNCTVFSDQGNHASIIDGIKLSGCEKVIIRHNDLNHLEDELKQPRHNAKAIIVESIYSTNGARADVDAINFLATKYHALLMIDEAHATGIFGADGAGLASSIARTSEHIITTHSCGKALASFGAFIACSEPIATIIKNLSRPFICTTAVPPMMVAHVHAVLDLLNDDATHRLRLHGNIAHAQGYFTTTTPIIAIAINSDHHALLVQQHLGQKKYDVSVFRYPSVQPGQAQLRITLHAGNSHDQIDDLNYELARLL